MERRMAVITFKNNPEKAYQSYLEQGYFVEPNVFAAEECERLIAAAQELATAKDGSYAPSMNPHKTDPLYLQAMSKPDVLATMDVLVRGKANGLQSQLFFTPPERAGLGFHQDNYFVEAPDNAFASAWVPLVDITSENGCVFAFPGSHKEGKLPVRTVNAEGKDKRQAVYEETEIPTHYTSVDLYMPRGSVLFIHGYIVHGSRQNRSRANRYALLNTYIREKEPFRAGRTAKREEFELLRA
jgi:ectoine hydroxylase-related dioxygenase (phytanoyl-CoA dioxygenase family)